jgi:hypothetical protein
MLKLTLLIFKLVLCIINKLLYVIIYNNWLKLVLYPKVWTLFGLVEYKSTQFNSVQINKPRSHLTTLGAKRVIWSKFHSKDQTFRHWHTQFSHHGDLAPWICPPLLIHKHDCKNILCGMSHSKKMFITQHMKCFEI